jgi:anaerobic magnesium-protoporphyrin IX monomethyl ester cyclase
MGRRYRQHSAQYVIKHMDMLISRYKVNHFHFEDDNFTLNRKRYSAILDHIIDNKLKITWDTPNGVRADMWDYNLLVKTKKAGCAELAFGVESGNQYVLDNIIRKKLDLKTVERSAGLCKRAGIDLKAFFIVGVPGETRQTMKETLDFAIRLMKKYNVTPLFSRLLPMFGTEIHVDAVKKGYISRELTPEIMATGNQETGTSLIETEEFNTEDVTSVLREMRRRTLFHQFKRLVTHPKLFWIKTYEQGPQTVKRYYNIFVKKQY